MKIRKNQWIAGITAAAAAAGLFLSPLPAKAATSHTQTVDMMDLIAPALTKNTDAVGVALQLSTAMRYGQLTQGDIWEMVQKGYAIPAEALKVLADGGQISGYLYKQAAKMAPTCSDLSPILDMNYYVNHNPEVLARVQSGALPLTDEAVAADFMTIGMQEGLPGSETFQLDIFKANYPELVKKIGGANADCYLYFLIYGKEQGLVADHLLK
ncbi:MAG: hypothetical protein ACI4OJ_10700 [Lachnospiraceae bacterium]